MRATNSPLGCDGSVPALSSDEGEAPLFEDPSIVNGPAAGIPSVSTTCFLQQPQRPPLEPEGVFVHAQRESPLGPQLTGHLRFPTGGEARFAERPITSLDPPGRTSVNRFATYTPLPS